MTNYKPAYYAHHRVRFEFRRSQVGAAMGTIYAIIYVQGQREEPKTTGIRATRDDWDSRTTPKRSKEAKELNEQLIYWEEALRSAAYSLKDRGEPITPSSLIAEKDYDNQPLLTLEETYKLFTDHKQLLVGSREAGRRLAYQIHPDTFVTYSRRWVWVKRYLAHSKQPKVLLLKVNSQFTQQFYYYLTTQKLGAAYATKCVKLLTEVCQWAFKAGHSRELRTGGFRGSSATVAPPHNVTEEEVCRIEQLVLTPSQTAIRDGWLLARELCLHYADYIDLLDRHFSRDEQGRLILEKSRVKQESGRNIKIVALVSERAERIWGKYRKRPPMRGVNNYMNKVIAEIGLQAGLKQKLTFSHARDSGIFRLVTLGCPDVQIKMAAGWTSTKQLAKYVNHDRRLIEELITPGSVRAIPEHINNPFHHIFKAS